MAGRETMSHASTRAWIDPTRAAAMRALVLNPASTALAREHWKYSKIGQATALLDESTDIRDTELRGETQPGVTVMRAVEPDAHDLELLQTRTAYCPATAQALLHTSKVDRILIRQTLNEPLEILQTDARRPVLIFVAGQQVEAHVHDRSRSRSGWLIIELGHASRVDFTRLRAPASQSEWQQLQFVLQADAELEIQHYCAGAPFRRLDILVALIGAGSSVDIHGCWTAKGQERLDQQWHVEHHAPHTRSTQIQHGIADGRANTTYRGRIFIGVDCPDVDASLINRNLALSPGAVCNTKPELEINSDDVRCSHGATVGQLPEESLFYFQSRGVDRETARTLLATGFINQCLQGDLADAARQQLLGIPND